MLVAALVFVGGGITGSLVTRARVLDECDAALEMGSGVVADVESYLQKQNPERPEYELQFVAKLDEFSTAYDECRRAPL